MSHFPNHPYHGQNSSYYQASPEPSDGPYSPDPRYASQGSIPPPSSAYYHQHGYALQQQGVEQPGPTYSTPGYAPPPQSTGYTSAVGHPTQGGTSPVLTHPNAAHSYEGFTQSSGSYHTAAPNQFAPYTAYAQPLGGHQSEAPYHQCHDSPTSTIPSSSRSSPTSTSSHRESTDRHVCTKCGKTFTRNFDVKRHMQTTHDPHNSEHNRCRYCAGTYSRSDSLKRHLDNGCDKAPRR